MQEISLYNRLFESGAEASQRGTVEIMGIKEPDTFFNAETKQKMLSEFCTITDKLYGADTSFHWFSKKNYFPTICNLWLVFKKKRLIGFCAIKVFEGCGEKIIYIDNMNTERTKGKVFSDYSVGSMLVNEILIDNWFHCFKPVSILFRTQNANVYRLGYSILPQGVYPRVSGDVSRDKKRSVRINTFMAKALSPGKLFIEELSIIKNAYKGRIYDINNTSIRSRFAEVQAFWTENVDLDNGDAVLISVCPKIYEFIAAISLYGFKLFRYLLKEKYLMFFRQKQRKGTFE